MDGWRSEGRFVAHVTVRGHGVLEPVTILAQARYATR
jgi:hypothetical protein